MIKEALPGGTSKGPGRQDRGGEEFGPALGFRQRLAEASTPGSEDVPALDLVIWSHWLTSPKQDTLPLTLVLEASAQQLLEPSSQESKRSRPSGAEHTPASRGALAAAGGI